jgi:hypothetical protein
MLEARREHAALPVEWKHRLGKEYQAMLPFLVPTTNRAPFYPSPYSWTDPTWPIYETLDGAFEAVPHYDAPILPLTAKDVHFVRWNMQKFRNQVGLLLKLEPTSEQVSPKDTVIRLGNYRIPGRSEHPVFMVCANSRQTFSREVSQLLLTNSDPFFVVTGSRMIWNSDLFEILKQRNVPLLAMDDVFEIKDGAFIPTPVWDGAIEAFRQAVCPENLVAVPDYEFARRGGWFIRYEGKQTVLPGELFGAFYIQRLLMKPCCEVHVTDLLAEFVGDDQLRIGSGGEEVIDHEARQNYKKRLEELVGQRAEAEKDDDEAWLERIDSETEQIASELLTITGLGGKTRKMGDDVYNIRRRISKTITDAIAKIKENDPSLARHLTNSITLGTMMNYEPDREIDWQFL